MNDFINLPRSASTHDEIKRFLLDSYTVSGISTSDAGLEDNVPNRLSST